MTYESLESVAFRTSFISSFFFPFLSPNPIESLKIFETNLSCLESLPVAAVSRRLAAIIKQAIKQAS